MVKRFILICLGVMLAWGCNRTLIEETTMQGEWVPVTLRAVGGGAPSGKSINAAQARLMAERAAKIDAYRNLLEAAYGVNISARSHVRDFVTKNDSIKARVDAYIRGARVVHTIHHDDGGVETEMEITLKQEFRRIFP